ncbi:MAG TPA: hypothetical protein PKD18_11330, partial [Saprospiraceae bacterium]|nr:hypothetical protein [Saprospiraceae bacterium]
ICILIFFAIQCKNVAKDEVLPTSNPIQINEFILKKKVIETGDIQAYENLYNSYLASPIPQELLFYSLYMADQYNYVQANYDVFANVTLLCKYRKKALTDDMAKLAIDNLIKASDLGHHQATLKVKEFKIDKHSKPIDVFKALLAEE